MFGMIRAMNETTMSTQEFDNQPLTVEVARPEDAEGVFEVQRRTWLATYPNTEAGITEEDIRLRVEGEHGELVTQKIERWRSAIETAGDKRAVFVVRDNQRVVGFVAPAIMDGQRRIGAIYVLPDTQDKGLGSKLLQAAIEWHGRDEDIYLHVASYNQNAIDFYKQNGFEETGKAISDEMAQLGNGKEIPEIEMVLGTKSGD
jgi:ribosomal protein S18 acetylase RimI-like enzyme